MRTEFLELGEDDWVFNLWGFLNTWGLWGYGRGFNPDHLSQIPEFVMVLPHQVLEKQKEYRDAQRQPHKWLSTHSLSFSNVDKPPYFLVKRHYCGEAIEATITIDHLEGRRWGFCKRHDCRKYFDHTSQEKRLYCSPECAHLANVRKLREEKRKTKKRKTGGKRNAKG